MELNVRFNVLEIMLATLQYRKVCQLGPIDGNIKTAECKSVSTCWTVLQQSPYSLDFMPPDFPLFGPMKDGLHGQHFPDNDAVIVDVRKRVVSACADFYNPSMQALVHH
jgi:hypothetical protein